jgi:hypothetical protein
MNPIIAADAMLAELRLEGTESYCFHQHRCLRQSTDKRGQIEAARPDSTT